jgi:hypothetical protein
MFKANLDYLKQNTFTLGMTFAFLLYGCGGEVSELEEIPQDEKVVSEQTTLFNVDNKVFYIPNPVQTALLMKDVASPYSKDLLNPAEKAETYTTSFKQAVNIGCYGADLGYITSSGQNQEALTHLGAVKTLADVLGVSSAFDFGAMESFGKNVGNQQEMLTFVTTAYKTSQDFLTNENRHDIAGIVMAGALIEGLHFACSFASDGGGNEAIMKKIGEHAQSLDNVILVLNPHYSASEEPELSAFIDMLTDLQTQMKGIKAKYTFAKSTIDTEGKTCKVNSTSEVVMNEKALIIIANKVKNIRDSITS